MLISNCWKITNRLQGLARYSDQCTARLRLKVTPASMLAINVAALFWTTSAAAQQHQVFVYPKFFYNLTNIQSCGDCSDAPGPYRDTAQEAFQDAVAQNNYDADENTSYSAQNLQPGSGNAAVFFNGIPMGYLFDEIACSDGNCQTLSQIGSIQTSAVCPDGGGPNDYGVSYGSDGSQNQMRLCSIVVSDIQPPPTHCFSCLGNPIYAATGQKLEVEPDYNGPGGLSFARTYRSYNGFFASQITQTLIDNSAPLGTTFTQCYPAYWTLSPLSGFYCFPYVSVYPNTISGNPEYEFQTEDGRSIEFMGSNSAIASVNPDINERITLLSSGGAAKWQIQRDDDSVELYNAAGGLIQKTLRGGRTFTYSYSAAGQLSAQSDAFGHTLSGYIPASIKWRK